MAVAALVTFLRDKNGWNNANPDMVYEMAKDHGYTVDESSGLIPLSALVSQVFSSVGYAYHLSSEINGEWLLFIGIRVYLRGE